MTTAMMIGLVNLLCVGLLAGEEFTICYGVRASVASLEDRSHILIRQALIYRLRVLVPIMLALTILSGIAVTILGGFDQGFILRCAGLAILFTFIIITLGGTVPINKSALDWNPAAPPAGWRAVIKRWEHLNTARCWLAIASFTLFLGAAMLGGI